MENKSIEISGKGIKVHILSTIFIVLGVLTMVASIFVIRQTYNRYDEMREAFHHVEMDREAAEGFKKASDYLTDEARKFAATGNIEYAINYFTEKDELKNREAALEQVDSGHYIEITSELLQDAMEKSEALVVYELHAMRLVADLKNIDASQISDEVASYVLTDDELSLSADEKHSNAIELLIGAEYEELKDRINWDVKSATELIKEESSENYRENEASLIVILNVATGLIFAMFILLVLIFIFNSLLVARPANMFIKALDNKEKLPEIGGYEFRKFARKYNNIYRSDRKNKELLKEQGEIDELTGVLKVGTLELVRHNLTQTLDPIGIMMVDIDNFRSIKESNGYEVADKLVAKTAKLFTRLFKSSDYIIRTSQDEFELFLIRAKSSDSIMLVERIKQINQKLQDTSDGVPAASVSVGVAFSDKGYDVEVERKADMALNYVKENGRANCKIAE